MKLHTAIFDDFFSPQEAAATASCLSYANFVDLVSELDKVTYPGILSPLPRIVEEGVQAGIERCLGRKILVKYMFARLTSSAQKEAPNKIHSDKIMGEGAALIYMSKVWPASSGTSFWSHQTEGDLHGEQTDEPLIQKHTNDLTKWRRLSFVEGKFNRILLYDARRWHCAEPIGGFGHGPQDGRIVLTCFFGYL